MQVFITGGCKNGKSTFALNLAKDLSPRRFYVATMVVRDEEDAQRVVYHRAARDGMGFQTVESPDLRGLTVEPGAVYLVDSVTALLQNAMFPDGGEVDLKAAETVEAALSALLDRAEHAVFISDYLYSNVAPPGGLTAAYVRALARLDRFLAVRCDRVVELCAATTVEHKPGEIRPKGERTGMELVIGGAEQGKLAYVESAYGWSGEQVCFCTEHDPLEPGKPCVYGLERYLLGCLRRGEEPDLSLEGVRAVVLTDLFCGLVPMDPETRAWRELCGKTAATLARRAGRVTRLFCGLPQRLK